MDMLQITAESVRKSKNMEEKIGILSRCFHPYLTSEGLHQIEIVPRRYFGYSIPSQATLDALHACIDTETEVVEIGSCLGLYAFVFDSALFCKRWVATDHPDTYKEWIPVGTQLPFTSVYITPTPLNCFSPDTPRAKRTLVTIWPEAESMYFWDDYVKHFDGDTVIIIGTPGVTGREEMWDLLSAKFQCQLKATTVCKINMGFAFDYESIFVWKRLITDGHAHSRYHSHWWWIHNVPAGCAKLAHVRTHARVRAGGARLAHCGRDCPHAGGKGSRVAEQAGNRIIHASPCSVGPGRAEGAMVGRTGALCGRKGALTALGAGITRTGTKGC
jgi:hypothetical protein